MRAIAEDEFNGPISLRDLPVPEIGANEVLIRVRAAGVNPFDWKVADGALKDEMEHRFPLILGFDAAGVVERVGDEVGDLAAGDGVYGYLSKPVIGAAPTPSTSAPPRPSSPRSRSRSASPRRRPCRRRGSPPWTSWTRWPLRTAKPS